MFELKVDPKFPHHYIIGVAATTAVSEKPGTLFLKYGPIHFTNEDVEKVGDCTVLVNDKIYRDIYKMQPDEIYKIQGCSELIMALIGMKLAASANMATLHHFSVEHELSNAEEFFEGLVHRANISEKERKQLNDSRVRGWTATDHYR